MATRKKTKAKSTKKGISVLGKEAERELQAAVKTLPGALAGKIHDPNDPEKVRIQPSRWVLVQIPIRGRNLLMNKLREDTIQGIIDKEVGHVKTPRGQKDPVRIMEQATHRDHEGDYALPAAAWYKTICSAAHKDKGLARALVEKAIRIPASMIKIKGSDPVMHSVVGFVGRKGKQQGNPTMVYRPLFEEWSCVIPVKYNRDLISLEELVNLIECAGTENGIGSWRPGLGSGGTFGMFEIYRGTD